MFTIFIRNPFPKHGLLPIETIIITRSTLAEFMYDKCCPSSRPPSLNAILGYVFNLFAHVRKAKRTLFGDEGQCNTNPPFIDSHRFVPNGPQLSTPRERDQ